MKYQIISQLFLDDESSAREIYEYLKERKGLLRTIRPGEVTEQKSFVQLARCYHDEEPPKPCELLESFESE